MTPWREAVLCNGGARLNKRANGSRRSRKPRLFAWPVKSRCGTFTAWRRARAVWRRLAAATVVVVIAIASGVVAGAGGGGGEVGLRGCGAEYVPRKAQQLHVPQ